MKHSKHFTSLILLSLILVAGCLTAAGCVPVAAPPPTATPIPPTPTLTPVSPTPTPIPQASTSETDLESKHADDSEITLYYRQPAQVELFSLQGTRVLIDVWDPGGLTSPPTAQDVLLTTHRHPDHYQGAFLDSFPGQQLDTREGEINLPDVTIRGIASAHNAGETLLPEGGTNYIFIVDMSGLRIAHFGDIGQEQLTQEQLDALGEVDVAITQLANDFSGMNIENKKGFNLMEQVQPKLIIPTHSDSDTYKHAMEMWESFYVEDAEGGTEKVMIGRSGLSDGTRFLVLGYRGVLYRETYDLTEWP